MNIRKQVYLDVSNNMIGEIDNPEHLVEEGFVVQCATKRGGQIAVLSGIVRRVEDTSGVRFAWIG